MANKFDPDVDAPKAPFVDEAEPGLGPRKSSQLQADRAASGNLPDQPVDNPVRNDNPMKNLRKG